LYLEIEETQEMLQMGFVREFTRAVQALRKKANLQKSDRIALFVSALASSQAALQNQAKEISQKVGASSIDFVAIKALEAKKNSVRISVKNFEASFGF
jgi:valyl-tRNA synthetase